MPEQPKEADLQAIASDAPREAACGLEPRGLDKLFVEHQARVFRAAYRITGNAQDAEDVLQTVFLRLARRDEAKLPDANIPSYLYRSALNAAFDVLRARQRAETVDLAAIEASIAQDDAAGPERAQADAEIRARVRRALGQLPARHAEVFVLRYLEGHRNRDVARMLGLSRITVAVVLHRVRHRLRKELRQIRGVGR